MKKIVTILYILCIISFFTGFSACKGQNNPISKAVKIELGTTVDQLDSTIWVIFQDQKSNYWFGSKKNGLFYYNGQNLKQITTEDGLVSNEIRGIQEDSFGNLFFDTEQGVSKFDGGTFITLPLKDTDSTSNNWILKPDDLWFRMSFNKNGVYRYDGEFLHFLKFPKSPQEDAFFRNNPHPNYRPYGLYTIYQDRNGFMWFGTASLGVCRFDGKNISWHYEEQLQTTPEGGDFGTRAVFEDNDGMFWINNTRFRYKLLSNSNSNIDFQKEDGMFYYNDKLQKEYPFFLSITQDNDDNLWMLTYDTGVWKYDGKKLIHYPVQDGGKDVLLFTIFKDDKGVLWLGSHNAGVFKFNGNSFEKF